MDPVEKLLAIEEIKRLKAKYFRAMDTKDLQFFGSLFAEDCVCDFRGATTDPTSRVNYVPSTENVIMGRATLMESVKGSLSMYVSVHHGFMPEIEITSSTKATGIWAVMDLLRSTDPESRTEIQGYGHYHETYEKIDGVWQIKTINFTRLRVDYRAA